FSMIVRFFYAVFYLILCFVSMRVRFMQAMVIAHTLAQMGFCITATRIKRFCIRICILKVGLFLYFFDCVLLADHFDITFAFIAVVWVVIARGFLLISSDCISRLRRIICRNAVSCLRLVF